MAQEQQSSGYKQGYSKYTLATQQARTAEFEASFLGCHIKKTDYVLDVGCGPGTITTSFLKYANEGTIVGVDLSEDVLERAKALAAELHLPESGPGSTSFVHCDVLKGLPYPDGTFDIVFCSQLLAHVQPREGPLKAISEMRRVLKPGGILASCDSADSHFYPRRLGLDRLWVQNMHRMVQKGAPNTEDDIGPNVPALFRSAGFDTNGGKVKFTVGTKVFEGKETRQWLAWRAAGQLKVGDKFHQSWLDAGVTQDEINETLEAVEAWAKTEDAWFVSLQVQTMGWK